METDWLTDWLKFSFSISVALLLKGIWQNTKTSSGRVLLYIIDLSEKLLHSKFQTQCLFMEKTSRGS